MFWLAVAVLLFPLLYLLVRPLLRSSTAQQQNDELTSLHDYSLIELQEAKNSQLINETEYPQMKQQAHTMLAPAESEPVSSPSKPHAILALLLVIIVVTGSVTTYLMRSNGYAMMVATQEVQKGVASLLDTIEQSKRDLAQNPDDRVRWNLLAEAHLALNQYGEAANAYAELERLGALDTADRLIAYAEILILANTNLSKAHSLLEGILLQDPGNKIAMFLYGTLEFKQGTYQAAVDRWEALYEMAGDEMELEWRNELLSMIEKVKMRAEAMQNGVLDDQASAQSAPDITKPLLEIRVRVDSVLAGRTAAEDTVFIYARAVNGSPMPLAVKRLTVANLPQTVYFSDNDAMFPSMLLSGFEQVQVFARISKSGQAKQQAGDFIGSSDVISLMPTANETISVTINIAEIVTL